MKKAFSLFITVIFVIIFAKITYDISLNRLFTTKINSNHEKKFQALLFLKDVDILINKLEFINNQRCLNNISFEKQNYKFELKFEYFTQDNKCKNIISPLKDENEFVIIHISITSNDDTIRVYKRIVKKL